MSLFLGPPKATPRDGKDRGSSSSPHHKGKSGNNSNSTSNPAISGSSSSSERRNRTKSANLQGLDLTNILDGQLDADGQVALSSIAESATVSHTDISVLQQAGFFNDLQALVIWKYMTTVPRDMSILEAYTKPMATDRSKRHARVKDSSAAPVVSSRETKKAEIAAKELENQDKRRGEEFRFRGKMKNTKLLDKMLQDQSVLNKQVDGTIVIKVKGASNLPSKEGMHTFGSSPDPYCVIRSTFSSHLRAKTKVIKNSINPRWDETFTFTVKQSSAKGDFHAIFFDKQPFGNDPMLGMCVIPLYNIVDAPLGVGINARLPFDVCKEGKKKKKSGEVETHPLLWIEIHYTPALINKEAQQLAEGKQNAKSGKPKMTKSFTVMEGDEKTKLVTEADVLREYELGEVLGSGATAVVKLGIQKRDNKKIAVKIVDKTKEEFDEDDQKAFLQEISILQRAKEMSDFLVYAIDVRETTKEIYIMMEYMNGGELFDYIFTSEAGCLTPPEAAKVVLPLLKGLNYLHNTCLIIHRDIKPENILLSFAGEDKTAFPDKIKISDYGASAFFTQKNPYVRGYTGTLTYMAPEILENSKYTKAIDVWSIGIVTYCSMCGFLPFDGDSDAEITQAILEADLQFPSPEWDGCDFLAQSFIISCLTSDPKKRMTIKDAINHPWILKHSK